MPLAPLCLRSLLGMLLAAACLRAAEPTPPLVVEDSVVKVFATTRAPEPYEPWSKSAPHDVSGTGVVIDGNRILTNAHIILYSSQIQVQAGRAGDKFSARVEFVSPGIDLAVLKLSDESFFAKHPPLKRASILPSVKDPVLVYGFPTGGTSLSITKGIVSRIEFSGYNYPISGLRIQIDAAINAGNSGGPAIAGDAMVGLAFSHLGGAENIGYIIPCEEIELFLQGFEGGRTYHKPGLFDDLQSLQNPALRAYLKAGPEIKGMVVTRPEIAGPDYPLKQWDIITAIGSVPIEDDGDVIVSDSLHVSFRYLVQKLVQNDHVPLKIFRAGHELTISMPVQRHRPMLLADLEGAYPSYFAFGPIVFSVATAQFFAGLSTNAAALAGLGSMGSPLITRRGDRTAFPGEQLVVVSSPYFPHDLAKGYDNATASVVEKVNGIVIKNLRHLVEVLRDTQEEFIRIEFVGRNHEDLVFRRSEIIAATDEILTDNGVRSQASPDLMKVWLATAPK